MPLFSVKSVAISLPFLSSGSAQGDIDGSKWIQLMTKENGRFNQEFGGIQKHPGIYNKYRDVKNGGLDGSLYEHSVMPPLVDLRGRQG